MVRELRERNCGMVRELRDVRETGNSGTMRSREFWHNERSRKFWDGERIERSREFWDGERIERSREFWDDERNVMVSLECSGHHNIVHCSTFLINQWRLV